ncbi:hypothetical protein PO909_006064 [Leuciscus waleckii]
MSYIGDISSQPPQNQALAPLSPAGGPRTMGVQSRVCGRGLNCFGTSIALSCSQYALCWAVSRGRYTASTYWSVRTALQRWSTLPSHVATRPPSPPIESEGSEVASCHSHPWHAQSCSRQAVMTELPGEWRLHPQVVQLRWDFFGAAQVDLFASSDSSHSQLFYSLIEGTLVTDALAHSWPLGLRKYAFPPVSLLAQTLCKVREDEEQVLLVAPCWPNRTWFPEHMLLATVRPWPIPVRKDLLSQRPGHLWHPRSDLWKLHVWFLDGTRRF